MSDPKFLQKLKVFPLSVVGALHKHDKRSDSQEIKDEASSIAENVLGQELAVT